MGWRKSGAATWRSESRAAGAPARRRAARPRRRCCRAAARGLCRAAHITAGLEQQVELHAAADASRAGRVHISSASRGGALLSQHRQHSQLPCLHASHLHGPACQRPCQEQHRPAYPAAGWAAAAARDGWRVPCGGGCWLGQSASAVGDRPAHHQIGGLGEQLLHAATPAGARAAAVVSCAACRARQARCLQQGLTQAIMLLPLPRSGAARPAAAASFGASAAQ